jgi:multidrug efflux pump subunit AcrB
MLAPCSTKYLPAGYHIDTDGSIEEAGKANAALLPVFPVMLIMIVIILQVRSFSSMAFTSIGGTLGGTVLTLVFLPALYALWHRIGPHGPAPAPARPLAA